MRVMKKIVVLTISLIFLLTFVKGFSVPYEDLSFNYVSEYEMICGVETVDSYEEDNLFRYLSINESEVEIENIDEDYRYHVDKETREIISSTDELDQDFTTHWIDTEDVDTGDDVKLSDIESSVRTTSDNIDFGDFSDIEAYRLSTEIEEPIDEMYEDVIVEGFEIQHYSDMRHTHWFDSYSGLILKSNIEFDFEVLNTYYQTTQQCETVANRYIEDTGLDSNEDGINDLTYILEERENPLKVEKELSLEVSEEEIKQYEEIDLEVSVNGESTEADIFLNDEFIEKTDELSLELDEPGDNVFEVNKSQEEVNNLIHDYESDSVTVEVEELSLFENIIRFFSNLF